MKFKLFLARFCALIAAVLPVVIIHLCFRPISLKVAILSIGISFGLINLSGNDRKRNVVVEVVATFVASAAMCVVLILFHV